MSKPKVFLGMPHHGKQVLVYAARAFYNEGWVTDGKCEFAAADVPGSVITRNCNALWAAALQARARDGYTHFAMLHSDIAPERFWLDILVEELEMTGGDMISAVVPIKGENGVTSTAIDYADDRWSPLKRLTMAEVAELPETFDATAAGYRDHFLLLNTGCCLIDLRKPWCGRVGPDGALEVCFTTKDRVIRAADRFVIQHQSEDWSFSRAVQEAGGRIYATQKVKLVHWGEIGYPNYGEWGTARTDPLSREATGAQTSPRQPVLI